MITIPMTITILRHKGGPEWDYILAAKDGTALSWLSPRSYTTPDEARAAAVVRAENFNDYWATPGPARYKMEIVP